MKKNREKILNKIFEEISSGLSLRKALEVVGEVSKPVFYKWIKEDEEKANQYARACEERQDKIFEEILEIADDSSGDEKPSPIAEGATQVDKEHIQRSRLRIDARKWMLGKMNPSKYGEKTESKIEQDVTISFK